MKTYKISAAALALVLLLTGGASAEDDGKNALMAGREDTAAVMRLLKQLEEEDKEKETADGEETEEEKEEEEVPQEMLPLDTAPLSDEDFIISGIALGGSIDDVIDDKGKADKKIQGGVEDEYRWDGFTVKTVSGSVWSYVERADLEVRHEIPAAGISCIYSDKKTLETKRQIYVGSPRENVVRVYGRPAQVLWDGGNKQFYLVYEMGKKELTFTVKDDKVAAIKISWKEEKSAPKRSYKEVSGADFLPERDFKIAGFTMGDKFQSHSWDNWERKMTRADEVVWYFGGYAVRTTANDGYIQALFLTDNKMLTTRGLAIGDDVTTLEALYGAPHKLEMEANKGDPRPAYVYFSREKRNVLIIYLKKNKVDGLVIIRNPLLNKQSQ